MKPKHIVCEMGTPRLLEHLKHGASEEIRLDDGKGRRLVMDGHAALHRAACRRGVAASLVLHNRVEALGYAVAREVRMFERFSWRVTVVFDGPPPPSKRGTTVARLKERENARSKAIQASGNCRDSLLVKAAHFSPHVVARTACVLRSLIRGECVTSPHEADGQLVMMQNYYLSRQPDEEVYIWANDSDVFVIGAVNLLWEVRGIGNGNKTFSGSCIRRRLLFRPSEQILRDTERGEFLRRLHSITDRHAVCFGPLLPHQEINERLLRVACIAGNDHFNFSGVGWVTASQIALDSDAQNLLSTPEVVHALATATLNSPRFKEQMSVEEAGGLIWASRCMFLDPIVFNPTSGNQQHLSGIEGSDDVTRVTGEYCYR